MSRLFRGYASAYSADQHQPRRVRRYQVRTLTADFNGAMDAGRTIASVTWECTHPECTYLQGADIAADSRSVSVGVQFNYSGFSSVKATVTLDDNSQLNYEFSFDILDAPLYPSAVYPSANGPYSLTAT